MAGSKGVNRNVDERVDTLAFRHTQISSHGETCRVVLWVEEISGGVSDRRDAFMVIIHLEVFPFVGEGGPAVSDRVTWLPRDGESVALRTLENGLVIGNDILRNDIARKPRVDIGAHRVTLGSVGVLGVEEFYYWLCYRYYSLVSAEP